MTISIVECGLKNVTCGVERNVLHNIITCNNLIGAALLTAAEQITYRHDTRPFFRVKGRARQTMPESGGPCKYAIVYVFVYTDNPQSTGVVKGVATLCAMHHSTW